MQGIIVWVPKRAVFVTFVLIVMCIIAIIVFGKDLIRRFYLSRNIQGPSWWEFGRFYKCFYLPCHILTPLCEITERYGYQVWGFWNGADYHVVLSDLQSVTEFFRSKSFDNKYEKYYNILSSYIGRGSVILNGSEWKRRRAVIKPAFKTQYLEQHLDVLHEESLELVDRLRAESQCDSEIDIRGLFAEQIIKAAFRFIKSRTLRIGDDAVDFAWAIEQGMKQSQIRGISPIYYYGVYMLSKKNREDAKKVKSITKRGLLTACAETEHTLHRLVVEKDTPKQLIEFLMAMNPKNSTDGLLSRDVLDETLTLFGAASETTKTVTLVSILLLALHQDVQSRLIVEIDSIYSSSGDGDQFCTPDNLNKMVYLDMVIKESLRLFPPAPVILRRAEEDTTLNGCLIPKGACVIVNIFGLHRNPHVYEDPLKFDPERFSKTGEGRKSDSPFAFIPFSYGPRNCVGMRHAMNLLKVYLSTLLRNFRFLPGKGLKSVDDIKFLHTITLNLEECNVRIVRRSAEK